MTEGEDGELEVDSEGRADLRLLYQDSLDNIRDLKRQQWTVTYYALLLYAALVGADNLSPDERDGGIPLDTGLIILAFSVAVCAVILIVLAQEKLQQRRERLHAIRKYFDNVIKRLPGSNKPKHTDLFYSLNYWGMMIIVVALGALVATAVIVNLVPAAG